MERCCAERWSTSCQNTLALAISAARAYTVLELLPGTYCNEGYAGSPSSDSDYLHERTATITGKSYLIVTAANASNVPRIVFDGDGGFGITSSQHISFSHLEVSGPALGITGTEATRERERVTGRILHNGKADGCGEYAQAWECNSHSHCHWSPVSGFCSGIAYPYYNGLGFDVRSSTDLSFSRLSIHHCPSAAIHVVKSDNILFDSNLVYGNTWWTTFATSAIAFADVLERASGGRRRVANSSEARSKVATTSLTAQSEAVATAEESGSFTTVSNNVIYANRNFIPFYLPSAVDNQANGVADYGTWAQRYILDGQGIALTRLSEYAGSLGIENNTIFDCGINGLSIQKTAKATVKVKDNRIFDNGRTSVAWEGRQNAGGFVLNSGRQNAVTLRSNRVSANADASTYQCYGSCKHALASSSEGNTACGGALSPAYPSDAFVPTDCRQQAADFQALRKLYPSAEMPLCPQYTPFRQAQGFNCVEPTTDERGRSRAAEGRQSSLSTMVPRPFWGDG